MSRLIDGKAIAAAVTERTAKSAAALRERGIVPTLAVVVATGDEGAAWYVRSIERAAARAGADCQVHKLDLQAGDAEIAAKLKELSDDADVHGIVCQTPLPDGVALADVGACINVGKDVDGANPGSLGRLAAGLPGAFAPATAAAVMEILGQEQIPLRGRRAVVIGRSNIVGKPAALLLLAEHATVTICHSRTRDLPAVAREADVLVAAIGRPKMITADYITTGGRRDRRWHQPNCEWRHGRRCRHRRRRGHRCGDHSGPRWCRPGYDRGADGSHDPRGAASRFPAPNVIDTGVAAGPRRGGDRPS